MNITVMQFVFILFSLLCIATAVHWFLSLTQCIYFFIVLTFLFIYLHQMVLNAWFSSAWSSKQHGKCILFARLYKAYVSMHAFNKKQQTHFCWPINSMDCCSFYYRFLSLAPTLSFCLCAPRITVHKNV